MLATTLSDQDHFRPTYIKPKAALRRLAKPKHYVLKKEPLDSLMRKHAEQASMVRPKTVFRNEATQTVVPLIPRVEPVQQL